ncbi:hypothetical protein HYU12_04495 [Candidatus Woesearchaeota archaeon]|nr:hypothetical protein [Candidatus Woesearchaeota archaeon]
MSSEERFTKITKHFFDTYALIEIYEGKEAYSEYVSVSFFTTLLNLFEFHQYLLRKVGEKEADDDAGILLPHLVDLGFENIEHASKFRTKNKGKNFSMVDCIGYVYAKDNDLIFVTGDREFYGFENVTFVK